VMPGLCQASMSLLFLTHARRAASGLALTRVPHHQSPASRVNPTSGSMPLQEDVVLPAAHAQQDLPYHRYMVPVLGVDRDLGGGPEWDLVSGDVIRNVDEGQGSATGGSLSKIDERSRRLDLAGRDRIEDLAH